MDTSPPLKPAASFLRFPDLPPELRNKIWLEALPDTDRALRLAIHHRTYSTMHSCVLVGGNFCNCHSRCPEYTEDQPSHIGVCMVDGFFALAEDDDEPEDDIVSKLLLRSLGSACRESRDVVTRAYPESLRVWQYVGPASTARRRWRGHGSRRSRQVRCNPATDILVITSMPDYSSLHPTEDGPDQRLGTSPRDARIARQFPRDPEAFRYFRKIVSSFQRVALDYVGSRADDMGDSDDVGDQTTIPEDVIRTPDTVTLLFWFESLRQLALWLNPRWWSEVFVEDRIWVDDVRTMPSPHYRELGDAAIDILDDYRRYARVQRDHAAADEDLHWIARPRPLPSKMGCYI